MWEYGMPSRIRTDNGAPFAETGLLGLSKLSLGWIKMGIIHEPFSLGVPSTTVIMNECIEPSGRDNYAGGFNVAATAEKVRPF
jgi:hypothetical protein